MNYKVLIPPSIKETIASWPLSRELRVQVYTRLHDELAAAPDKHLGEQVAPLMVRTYSFVLADKGPLPLRHLFVFFVDPVSAAKELRIVGCCHSTEATGDN